MGYHRKTTPNIDRMAREGLYFENAIASGVPTPSSMVGVFTGEYSLVDTTCVDPKPWREEFTQRRTIAQVLSDKGYYAGAIHENAYVSKYYGFNKGFKYYNDSPTANSFKIKMKIHNKILVPMFRKLCFSTEIPDMIMGVGVCVHWESYYNIIINWIKTVKEPLFLWVLLLDTHTPYIPPRKFRKHCNSFQAYYYAWKLGKILRAKSKANENSKKKFIDIYDDCIRYADAFVKRLWDDLKDADPIFIIHADHGDGFGEHEFYQHIAPHWLYEELVHVPLVIYNADVKGKIEEPVSLLGIAPTILELINEQNEFPSKSLLHYDKGWVVSKIFSEGRIKVAVRTKHWKFITGQKSKDELYYLKKDPYEQINVIDEHPDLAKEMGKIAELHIKHSMEIIKVKNVLSAYRFKSRK